MSLLDNASLLLTPNAYKEGKLYSVIPSNGNGDFTATRATTATRINSSGLVESVALNVPRVDYSLGGCPNILLEPQRTNLALQSSSFDSATWVKTATTITANTTTSPSGVVDADTLTANGLLLQHQCQQAINTTSGVAYTISFYLKKDTNNFAQIFGASTSFGVNAWANFDLNLGVVGSVGSGITAAITSVGNGWFRCSITATATATISGSFSVFLVTSATATRAETNTLTTSFFLWGAQLEAGAYATSFIPTTTASVTRNADSITRNNIFTNGLITASGGTWFVELRNDFIAFRSASSGGIFINTGTASNTGNGFSIRNGDNSTTRFGIGKFVGGVFTPLFVLSTSNAKIAIKWDGTTADVFVNGVKVVAATSFTPIAMENLIMEGSHKLAFINEMALFPTPLTDAQCLALTA